MKAEVSFLDGTVQMVVIWRDNGKTVARHPVKRNLCQLVFVETYEGIDCYDEAEAVSI